MDSIACILRSTKEVAVHGCSSLRRIVLQLFWLALQFSLMWSLLACCSLQWDKDFVMILFFWFVSFNCWSSFENMCDVCRTLLPTAHFRHIVYTDYTFKKNGLFHWWTQFFRKLLFWGIVTNLCSNFLVSSYLKAMQTRGKYNSANLAKKLKNWRWLYMFL